MKVHLYRQLPILVLISFIFGVPAWAADPSFLGEITSRSTPEFIAFIERHVNSYVTIDVTYKPVPAGSDLDYDGSFTLWVRPRDNQIGVAHVDFLDRFQYRNITFNDINREPTTRLNFKGSGRFELVRQDPRIPFARYRFVPLVGSESERALLVKGRKIPLH